MGLELPGLLFVIPQGVDSGQMENASKVDNSSHRTEVDLCVIDVATDQDSADIRLDDEIFF
jgi:hypothetical protein